jgi:tetratricopeptide (TPR) repeat protein/transcriptional regulator with XRE-family HTH domain
MAPSSFGEMLKALRKRVRLTQQELASKLGVHRNTIGVWERGDFLPETKGMVLELAKLLRLSELETRHLLEASLTGLPPLWQVPYLRNPYFTGREDILEALHQRLAGSPVVALTQSYALHGLGGIGKTHLAVEYTYRYGLCYAAVFWIGAESGETVLSSFVALADLLQLPEREVADQQKMVAAVQRWLSTHSQWLLIWDNVEDLALLQRFLPATRAGAILLTTRRQALGTLAEGIELPTMTPEEGELLLFRRAKILSPKATLEERKRLAQRMPDQYQAAQQLVAEMDGLPLALDQAGAYVEETSCSLADYLELFQTKREDMLRRRGEVEEGSHPMSVVTTWSISFEKVEQANPVASDLLRLCAFLAPDAIPEAILLQGVADRFQLHEALRTVSAYSLLRCQTEARTYSMHRLVQAVVRDSMAISTQRQWMERAVYAVNVAFPAIEFAHWPMCERLLSHALVAATWIEQAALEMVVSACLLNQAGEYLYYRGRYPEAEPLHERALAIREEILGAQHPNTGESLNNLAELYRAQGKYEQAEPLHERALTLREEILGAQHPDTANSLNNLALLYATQGKYEQAEPLHERALALREEILGAQHPDTATCLNNLALLYATQGKYEQAEPLHRRALAIREQQLGAAHPNTALSLNNLAVLYQTQGRYADAEPLSQRALHIWEQTLGKSHPWTHKARCHYADLLRATGRDAEAEKLEE